MDMKKENFISVIIPTYNRLQYVQEAIDSVLAQTYRNYELIVVDDGSMDDTGEMIKAKYNGRLHYYFQNNQGESVARNYGASKAKGEYLAFLDSDDKWHLDKLKYQVKALEKNQQKDDRVALVCSSVWLIDSQGLKISSKPGGRSKKIHKRKLEDFLLGPGIFAPPSNALLIKDRFHEVGGFDEDISFGEDWLLLIKLREKFKFCYLDKPLTYYRIHNVDQQRFPKHHQIEKKLSDLLKIAERFPERQRYEKELALYCANTYLKAAYWYFLYEDWNNGLNELFNVSKYSKNILEDKENMVNQIGEWGLATAHYKIGSKVGDMINYFNNVYYPNLQTIWPNPLLNNSSIKNEAWASFCHYLLCKNSVIKNKSELRYLSLQALKYRRRFLRSVTTWKLFISSFIS